MIQIKHRYTGATILELDCADLRRADLRRADLRGAVLRGAVLSGADLRGAVLSDADLSGADLRDADLSGATMPDGRSWEAYSADHIAGLCTTDEIRQRALAAWGKHTWQDCPLHMALGIDSPDGASDPKAVACWVALYDSGLLERPA